jgi:hypothetical protein
MRPETATETATPMSIKIEEEDDDLTENKEKPAADNWAVDNIEDVPK